jgi:hypothetical protein
MTMVEPAPVETTITEMREGVTASFRRRDTRLRGKVNQWRSITVPKSDQVLDRGSRPGAGY